jgi:flagellar basal body-associated protein FliL
MITEKLKTKRQGITLIALVITITILLILAGLTVTFVVDDKVVEKAENYTQAINNQVEEQESLSNMVRNLYR